MDEVPHATGGRAEGARPAMSSLPAMERDERPGFESLIVPHLDAAYTLARHIMRDDHDAQDAVQEGCLRALRYLGGFLGGPGEARAWFLAIVRNVCYTARRRQTTRGTVALESVGEPADERGDVEVKVERRLQRAALAQAIAGLPDDFRETLLLRESQGLSYKEISTVQQIPIGTVMSRLARARALLRRALSGTITAAEVG